MKLLIFLILKKSEGTIDITVLHCNTEYPTPIKAVNLRAMVTMKAELQVPMGYSDHTIGIEVLIAVVALGALDSFNDLKIIFTKATQIQMEELLIL